ncbi:hypothetical protein KJ782_00855 [Patescibacteria group bacterium]|nr:hypothetical protein [Patescibacteria group bacterium]
MNGFQPFIGRPMDEVRVSVDPIGNVQVDARSTQALELPDQVIESTDTGTFRESSRAIGEPIQILGPGMSRTEVTEL